jgi:predicted DNA binding CopG/RHH family protein
MNDTDMLDEYNFEKSIESLYARRLKKSITIRLDSETISSFKGLSKESEIPYQTLINYFLSQCVKEKRKPEVVWE